MASRIAPVQLGLRTTLSLASALLVNCSHVETATPLTQSSAVTATPLTPSSAVTATPLTPSSAVTAPPQTQTRSSAIPEFARAPVGQTATITSKPDEKKKPCLLLAVGDSLTDPKSAGGGYLTFVERNCGCKVVNLGKGGDMVNQMKSRLATHLSSTNDRYDWVLVFGGVNDLYSDLTAYRTVAKISRDLQAIYLTAKNHGAKVIAVTVAPWGGFRHWYTPTRAATTRELNAFIRTSPERGLTDFSVDAYAELSCGDSERLCDRYGAPFKDGLHFGPLGHRRLGMALVRALGKERCSLDPDGGSASAPEQESKVDASTKR
jgi:lysophospholipase L1-like esterase